MTMLDWAKHEVELACEHEDGYVRACYQSAMKAFESLIEDNHSVMSFEITANILKRLMRQCPLAPIVDTEDIWIEHDYMRNDHVLHEYQCKRMWSLFKTVCKGGKVEYHDTDRYICVNLDDPNDTWTGGGAGRILDEFLPIEMPYYPTITKYRIFARSFDDYTYYSHIITPDDKTVYVRRWYGPVDGTWRQLTRAEYQPIVKRYNEAKMRTEDIGNVD